MPRRRKPDPRWLPLETPRLILREFREGDLGDIHAYGADPEVTRFMIWGPNTPDDSRQFLGRVLEAQQSWPRASVSMAVELRAARRIIGATHLAVIDEANRTGEIGYTFGREHWGRGYAAEAAEAMLRQAFERLRLHRVIATCNVRNTRSWRLMEKLGMRREGCFRQCARVKGRWRNSYLYALLAKEWRSARVAASSI